jgi:hypothetical protein
MSEDLMKVSEEKRANWEQHLKSWQSSGLTQKDYCIREGLAYSSFNKQRSRVQNKAYPQAPRFIEATPMEPKNSSNTALVLQISLANGARIGVSAQASSEMIEQVLTLTGRAS